jgi:hypothetical protein
MLIGLKRYVGDKTHDTTSWYMFEDSDTKDKSKALWSIEDSEVYKEVLDKDISIPEGETYFVVAVRNFDDDTTEETLKMPITQYDVIDIYPVDNVVSLESPVLKVTANALSTGGEISITTNSIRPVDAIFKETTVVAFVDGVVVSAFSVEGYSFTLQSSVIPEGGTKLVIKASHSDVYGSMSQFGYAEVNLKVNICSLKNNVIIPTLPYKPLLVTDKDFELNRIELIVGAKIVYQGNLLEIPEEFLNYDMSYRLVVHSYIDGEPNRDEFNVKTISKYTEFKDDAYVYGTFQESNFDILENDGNYTHLQNNKCFVPIDKDKFAIKFYNTNGTYYETTYTLDNEPDFDKPIEVITISNFEVLFNFTSKDDDMVITRFKVDPTLYRATKVFETTVDSIVSNVTYSHYDDTMYGIKEDGDSYYMATINTAGTVDALEEVIETSNIGDNLYVTSNDNKICIAGNVDGFIQYTIGSGQYQILKGYDDDVKDRELAIFTTANNGIVLFVKENRRILVYDINNDELTEFENTIEHIDRILKLPNGSFLLKNETEQIIFK